MYLIIILLLIVLLAPIVANLSTLVGINAAATRSFAEATATRAGIDAIALHVARSMGEGDARFIPRVGAIERVVRVAGDAYAIAIESELGKLDLNAAPPAQLARLFLALGLAREQADAVAQAIGARRGVEPAGPGAAAWPESGPAPGPRGRFVSVGELAAIAGVPQPLLRTLWHHLTVHSERAFVDPLFASEPVLMAVTDLDAARVDAIVREREALAGRAPASSSAPAGETAQLYSLRIAARRLAAASPAARRVVVRVVPGGAPRLQILEWGDAPD